MRSKAKKATAADWNRRYGIGTKVRYWPVMGLDDHVDTVTRSEAFEIGGGIGVVLLEGSAGGKALSHLHVIEAVAPAGKVTREFIVLCGSIVGSEAFETVYSFDGRRFADRAAAIAHGFTLDRSDDFNIGVVQDGRLVSLDWMEKPVDTEPDVLAPIAAQVGLGAPA